MQMFESEKLMLQSFIKDKYYLEIGSGESTKWASSFCKKIDSVETRKDWYDSVKGWNKNSSNVNLYHFAPEDCAYLDDGYETLVSIGKGRNDYGTYEEFKTYIENIENLIIKNQYDIILIDGNVRNELVHLLKKIKFSGIFLVHDISSEGKMDDDTFIANFFDLDGLQKLCNIDRLWAFRFEGLKNG